MADPLLVGAAVLAIVVVVAVAVSGGSDDDGTDASADPTTGSTSSTLDVPVSLGQHLRLRLTVDQRLTLRR